MGRGRKRVRLGTRSPMYVSSLDYIGHPTRPKPKFLDSSSFSYSKLPLFTNKMEIHIDFPIKETQSVCL